MVEFDTTFLTLMFVPGAKHELSNAKARVSEITTLLCEMHNHRSVSREVVSPESISAKGRETYGDHYSPT